MVRLDYLVREYIKENFGINLSRSYIERILESGAVKFNGEVVKRKGIKFKDLTYKDKLVFDKNIIESVIKEYTTGRSSEYIADLWNNSESVENLNIDNNLIEKSKDLADDIVFEDNDYIITYKPPGVLAHPGRGRVNEDTMVYRFIKYMNKVYKYIPRAGLVHRLDADTQGLLVFAKNMSAYNNIKRQFADKQVLKIYLAGFEATEKVSRKIWPIFKESLDISLQEFVSRVVSVSDTTHNKAFFDYVFRLPSIKVDGFISRKRNTKLMKFEENKLRLKNKHFGQIKDASSIFYPGFTLQDDKGKRKVFLFVRILTGRTHQIRAQSKYLGLKLIGDKLYAKDSINTLHLVSMGISFYHLDGNRVYFWLDFNKITGLGLKNINIREFKDSV